MNKNKEADMHQVKCPKCGSEIDVQDILAHQLEEEIKGRYQEQIREIQEARAREQEKLREEKEKLDAQRRKQEEEFNDRLQQQLRSQSAEIEMKLKKKLEEDQAILVQTMQNELNEKTERLKELNKSKAEIERLKREKEELKDLAEAEAQKRLNETLMMEREKIRKMEEEKNEMKLRELQKQLEDQKKLTEEMKRKQEQGSMQLQGEVQELAIEEWLQRNFPFDTIDEIRKGARGGDCIQIVNTSTAANCGKIYYESKRTKEFQAGWIEKFKADMREKGASIGVLVTDAMPAGMERMGQRDGIWICNYSEFKGLCSVLREFVVQLSNAVAVQENKGDKMQMLYGYLTSNIFRMQVEAIVEGFISLKNALESEKRSMQRIWKEREKQIEKVTCNTIEMYSSIRGIAGSAIQPVKALELGAGLADGDEDEM